MVFYTVKISNIASSGTFSVNTLPIAGGIVRQIYIKSTLSDTTFDFKITSPESNVIYDTAEEEKTATNILNVRLRLPIIGINTLTVYNASNLTDTFTGIIVIQ